MSTLRPRSERALRVGGGGGGGWGGQPRTSALNVARVPCSHQPLPIASNVWCIEV